MPLVRTLVLIAASIAFTTAAQAQAVNKCRVDGRIVFQSAACPAEAKPVAVASAVETTPAPTRKRTLADVLRERDQAERTPSRAQDAEPQSDGANVLRARMGAV